LVVFGVPGDLPSTVTFGPVLTGGDLATFEGGDFFESFTTAACRMEICGAPNAREANRQKTFMAGTLFMEKHPPLFLFD
jgi:hypothetical protein